MMRHTNLLLVLLLVLPCLLLTPATSVDVTTVDWVTAFGTANTDLVHHAVVVPDSAQGATVYLVGSFSGTLTLPNGGASYVSRGDSDAFVARCDGATGEVLWLSQAGGVGHDEAVAVVVIPGDPSANRIESVVVAGNFQATAWFGLVATTSTLTLQGSSICEGDPTCHAPFLARYTAATGDYMWSQGAVGPLEDVVTSLILTAAGIWTTSHFQSGVVTYSAGGVASGALATFTGVNNGVLARFDPDNGALMFGRRTSSYGSMDLLHQLYSVPAAHLTAEERSKQAGEGGQADAASDFVTDYLVLVGSFRGDATPPFALRPTVFSVTDQSLVLTSRGASDVYIIYLTASTLTMNLVWSFHIGGSEEELLAGTSVAVPVRHDSGSSRPGCVVAATYASSNLRLGDRPAASPLAADNRTPYRGGGSDCLLVRVSMTGGDLVWAVSWGGAGADSVAAVAVHEGGGYSDGGDAVWVVGGVTEAARFGEGTSLATTIGAGGYLAKFDAASGLLMFVTSIEGGSPSAIVVMPHQAQTLLLALAVQDGDSGAAQLTLGRDGTRGTSPPDVVSLGSSGSVALVQVEVDHPVDCVITDWSPWSPCSAMCDGGLQSRKRVILRHPSSGGYACPTALAHERSCNTAPCVACILPTPLPPRVVPACLQPSRPTWPIECSFECATPDLRLEWDNMTRACDQATGAWSGAYPRCRLPPPRVETPSIVAPAQVHLAATSATTHRLAYAVFNHAALTASHGGDQLATAALVANAAAAVPHCSAADSHLGPSEGGMPHPAVSQAPLYTGVASGPSLWLSLEVSSTVAVVACGAAEEGDSVRSGNLVSLVVVKARPPLLAIQGPPTNRLVSVLPAREGQASTQVAATLCRCFLPSVSCHVSRRYTTAVYALLPEPLAVGARSCPHDGEALEWSMPADASITVSQTAASSSGIAGPVTMELELRGLPSIPDLAARLEDEVTNALVVLQNPGAMRSGGQFTTLRPALDYSRVAVQGGGVDGTWERDVNVTLVLLPSTVAGSRSSAVLAAQLVAMLVERPEDDVGRRWIEQHTVALRHVYMPQPQEAQEAPECVRVEAGGSRACLGASVGGSGDVGVPGATPVSGPSGLAFGVDDDAAAGRDGGNVDVGGVVAVAAACVSALLVLILCCCLGLYCHYNRGLGTGGSRRSGARGRRLGGRGRSQRGRRYSQIMVEPNDVDVQEAATLAAALAASTASGVAASAARVARREQYFALTGRDLLEDLAAAAPDSARESDAGSVGSGGGKQSRRGAGRRGRGKGLVKVAKVVPHRRSLPEDDGQCVVCMDAVSSVMLRPCEHLCMCVDCANHPSMDTCPLCRTRVAARLVFSWDTHTTHVMGVPQPPSFSSQAVWPEQ